MTGGGPQGHMDRLDLSSVTIRREPRWRLNDRGIICQAGKGRSVSQRVLEQATRDILSEVFLRLRRMEKGLSLADLMHEKVKVRYGSIRWD